MIQVVEHLPSKRKILSSNPSTPISVHTCVFLNLTPQSQPHIRIFCYLFRPTMIQTRTVLHIILSTQFNTHFCSLNLGTTQKLRMLLDVCV
jgi:hypothetical protein